MSERDFSQTGTGFSDSNELRIFSDSKYSGNMYYHKGEEKVFLPYGIQFYFDDVTLRFDEGNPASRIPAGYKFGVKGQMKIDDEIRTVHFEARDDWSIASTQFVLFMTGIQDLGEDTLIKLSTYKKEGKEYILLNGKANNNRVQHPDHPWNQDNRSYDGIPAYNQDSMANKAKLLELYQKLYRDLKGTEWTQEEEKEEVPASKYDKQLQKLKNEMTDGGKLNTIKALTDWWTKHCVTHFKKVGLTEAEVLSIASAFSAHAIKLGESLNFKADGTFEKTAQESDDDDLPF